ncbi:MAG TPA: DUF3572 domain-containing protein [Saliniramus sp.]|nr:DUF3572 domain-containing protein [Saliniramus sp.]
MHAKDQLSKDRLSPSQAEEVAIAVFGRITADEERLGRFFDLTGLRPDGMREAAASPGFFENVLDHVVSYEPLLISIAGELRMRPERIVQAHACLAPRFE